MLGGSGGKDLEPGSCARPQMARQVSTARDAFQRMRGSDFSLEYKFDGLPCLRVCIQQEP